MVYLVEAFRSRHAPAVRDVALRAQAAASRRSVRLLGRLVVPSDEIEFWLFDAASRDDLTAALAAGDIGGNRISPVEDLTLVVSIDGTGS